MFVIIPRINILIEDSAGFNNICEKAFDVGHYSPSGDFILLTRFFNKEEAIYLISKLSGGSD